MAAGASIWYGAQTGQAVPACPVPFEVTQPDGTVVRLRMRGDESFHWHESDDGYTVVRDRISKSWVYADIGQDGDWTTTVFRVGRDRPPARFGKRMLPVRRLREGAEKRKCMLSASAGNGPEKIVAKGTLKNLVLLVQFPDLKFHYGKSDFDRVLNETGYSVNGALGSVRDYYKEISYGKLNLESVIAGPVTVSNGYAYYGENAPDSQNVKDMVAEALSKLESSGFDFSQCDADGDGQIDGFDVIHAGWGAEYGGNSSDYIWSHKWQLRSPVTYDGVRISNYHTESELYGWASSGKYKITPIGVICHETGHFLGLPDLYDTDDSSTGIGEFCLMASGSWNGPDGASPAHMSAWCKAFLGWVTPETIRSSGTYSLSRVEDSGKVYKLHGQFSSEQEYFLLENRQGHGFDRYLPGSTRGMLIWHVDDRQKSNANEHHYWVDLEEASGVQHLESGDGDSGDDADYFRSTTKSSFSATTTPNNRSYSGESLGVDISGIGASGTAMSFSVKVAGEGNTLSVTPSSASFGSSSGTGSFTVNCDSSWTVSSSVSWVVPSKSAGSGSGSVGYSVSANTSSASRSGEITVVSDTLAQTLTIRQAGKSMSSGHFTIDNGVLTAWDGLGGTDLVIPEGVTEIADDVFFLSDVTSVKFPSSLKIIGASAFGICKDLTNVTFNAGLQTIKGQAFGYNDKLTGLLNLPEGVQTIDYCAFTYTGYEWAVIPSTVRDISWGAFGHCSSLKRVYFKGNAPAVNYIFPSSDTYVDTPEDLVTYVPYGSTGWKTSGSSTLPNQWPDGDGSDARSIMNYSTSSPPLELGSVSGSFSSSAQQRSFAVRTISNWSASTTASWISFSRATGSGFGNVIFSLQANPSAASRTAQIRVSSGSTSMAYSLTQRGTADSELDHFTIEDGVLTAWDGEGPNDVVIPAGAGIREIGEKAFYAKRALTSVVLPSGVKKIGDHAFGICSYLTNVVFNSDLEEIGEWAFSLDRSLNGRLYVPDSVRSIGSHAFWGTGYSSAVLPGGLTLLGYRAFNECMTLRSVYFRGNAPKILGGVSWTTISSIYEEALSSLTTYVPYGSTGWSGSGTTLPSLWPIDDGEHARAIRNYSPTFTVRLNKNDGSGTMKSVPFSLGVAQSLPWFDSGLKWTRSGDAFLGWGTSAGTSVVKYANGEKILDPTDPGMTLDLYAIWKAPVAQTYKVTFHRNWTTSDGATYSQTLTVGKAQTLAWKDSQIGWGNPSGKTFLGWSKTKTATVATYANGQSVTDLGSAGSTVDLYAVWGMSGGGGGASAQTYKVTFHRNWTTSDGATYSQTLTVGKAQTLAWKDSQIGWGNPSGKTFLGWSKTKTATVATYANGQSVTDLGSAGSTVDLYAVWGTSGGGGGASAQTYKVTFHRNWTTSDGATYSQTLAVGKAQTLAWKDSQIGWGNPSGKTFLGWGTSATAMVAFHENGGKVKDLAAAGKTVDLYAIWRSTSAYVVRYHRNYDGTDAEIALQAMSGSTLKLAWKDAQLGWANPSGRTFLGWSLSKTATRADYANGASVMTLAKANDIFDFYAVWSGGASKSAPVPQAAFQAVPSASSWTGAVKETIPEVFEPGYYRGEFADGSGTFDLLVYEDGAAFFRAEAEDGVWSAECEAEIVGDALILTLEADGPIVIRVENGILIAE